MAERWDEDIARMDLSEVEKNGLQVFRNYSRAFETEQGKRFLAEVDRLGIDIEPVRRLHNLILTEDVRMVVVIVCAFMDDQLKEMYRRELPDNVPGGRGELLGAMGPLSRLAQRIQVSFAFGWLEPGMLTDAYRLRGLRNDISHKWDMEELRAKMNTFMKDAITPVELFLEDERQLPRDWQKTLDQIGLFRVRLVWIAARFYYECWLYPKAVKARLDARRVLYGQPPHAELFRQIGRACVEATNRLIRASGAVG